MTSLVSGRSIDSDTSHGKLLEDLLKVQPIAQIENEAPPTNEMFGRMVVRFLFSFSSLTLRCVCEC